MAELIVKAATCPTAFDGLISTCAIAEDNMQLCVSLLASMSIEIEANK